MDYEQKYKEALERARKLYERGTITESLGHVFPELKESEDERIRKVLVEFFKSYKEQGTCGSETFNGIPTDNIIAWLEKQNHDGKKWIYADEYYKDLDRLYQDGYEQGVIDCQKEQKPIKWSKEDERMLASCGGAIHSSDTYSLKDKDAMVRWLNSLKERMRG